MNSSRPRLRLGITGAALAAALLAPGTAAAETGSAGSGSADTLSSAESNILTRISTAIICMINPQSSSIGGPMGGTYPICGPGMGG